MLQALLIAKRDFKSHIYSARSGLIFFLFLAFMGLFFSIFATEFERMLSNQSSVGASRPSIDALIRTLLENAQTIFIFAVPAITMVSFAKEKKEHSLKLLESAPVSAWAVTFGKFWGAYALFFSMLASSWVYVGLGFYAGNPDPGIVLGCYLGLSLLLLVQVALCNWLSALTSSATMAYLLSIFALFFMLIFAPLLSFFSLTDQTKVFLEYLAIGTHLNNLNRGLISVADISYFFLASLFFLYLTQARLNLRRWS